VSWLAKDRLAELGPMRRIGLLALAMTAALAVALPVAICFFGGTGITSVIIAALVVFASSAIASGVGDLFCQGGQIIPGVLVAMLFRMAFPLVACATAYFSGSRLANAGFVYFVLAFYLIVLPLETWLSVLRIQPPRSTT
jgi:hypothetical protein